MGRNRILFKKKSEEEWTAYLENNPEINNSARKKTEAAGQLYMQNAHRLNITVDGEQQEASCCHCRKE